MFNMIFEKGTFYLLIGIILTKYGTYDQCFACLFFLKFDMLFYSNIHVYPPTFYGMPYEIATRQWSFRIRGLLNYSGCKGIYQLNYGTSINNRAYPENTNFETFVPRNMKFHTFGELHTTK